MTITGMAISLIIYYEFVLTKSLKLQRNRRRNNFESESANIPEPNSDNWGAPKVQQQQKEGGATWDPTNLPWN